MGINFPRVRYVVQYGPPKSIVDLMQQAGRGGRNGSQAHCQGRSQDFSVGTHSFPSHLFTPAPPPQKKIKVIFDSRVFYFKSRAQES